MQLKPHHSIALLVHSSSSSAAAMETTVKHPAFALSPLSHLPTLSIHFHSQSSSCEFTVHSSALLVTFSSFRAAAMCNSSSSGGRHLYTHRKAFPLRIQLSHCVVTLTFFLRSSHTHTHTL